MNYKEILVHCRNWEERKKAVAFLCKKIGCGFSSFAVEEAEDNEIPYVYYAPGSCRIFGSRQSFGISKSAIVEFSKLDTLTEEIDVYFNDFHSAKITKKGIKFPWREGIFPLTIVSQLITAKKACLSPKKSV